MILINDLFYRLRPSGLREVKKTLQNLMWRKFEFWTFLSMRETWRSEQQIVDVGSYFRRLKNIYVDATNEHAQGFKTKTEMVSEFYFLLHLPSATLKWPSWWLIPDCVLWASINILPSYLSLILYRVLGGKFVDWSFCAKINCLNFCLGVNLVEFFKVKGSKGSMSLGSRYTHWKV